MHRQIHHNMSGKESRTPEWQPLRHSFLSDTLLADKIHETGFGVAGMLDNKTAGELSALYSSLHAFRKPEGGMFYSVYSRDIEYRKKVHQDIGNILKPVYDGIFHDYKSVLNSFIVKVPGPESEFSLHQDSTGLDETKYSCLSAWIPLQDTDVANGCMFILPHSHKMFSPYRGISISAPFESITGTVRKYMVPLELKAGEILLFDNRLVHNSVVNQSGKDRVVVMSGIFPAEANLLSCYKDSSNPLIELIGQEEDFLLTYENFNHDCTCRPEVGRTLKFVEWDLRQMDEDTFAGLCRKYGMKEVNHPAVIHTSKAQAIIGEPVN